MKCFGYAKGNGEILHELTEVAFQMSPEETRRMASFFMACADKMESDNGWEHEHFRDYAHDGFSGVDVILFAEKERATQ